MPYTLPPITLTENVTSPVNIPGNLGSVTYLKMVNASPYLVQINNLLGGSDYMQPGEANVWPVPGLNTAVQVTPLAFVSPVTSPSSVLVVTWYLEGEQPNGNYPVNFNLLSFNGGNVGVASSIVNDSSPAPTLVIEMRPSGQTQSFFALYNDGTADWWVLRSDGIAQEVFKVINQAGAKTGQLIFPGGFASTGNGAGVFTFDDGLGNLTTSVLHATFPVKLISGNQETGTTGGGFTASAASQYFIVGENFKTTMTNAPTSITLTAQFSANTTAPTADSITVTGFHFFFQSSAAGLAQWYGTYTTVGNCLLAYDATVRTFDHHCEQCGAVHRAVALEALEVSADPTPARNGLAYICPGCGTGEHFNCGLTAADEADTTPQGSGEYATTRGAQTTLIRQLMTALGLPVA